MIPGRRSFLQTIAPAASTALPTPVFAGLAFGEATLTTVSDGLLTLPSSFVFDGGRSPSSAQDAQPRSGNVAFARRNLTLLRTKNGPCCLTLARGTISCRRLESSCLLN